VAVSRVVIEGSYENRKKRTKKMKKEDAEDSRNSSDTLLEMEEMVKTWRKIE
jgi:hypothetical protein